MSQDAEHKSTFFRQSGWLMIANVLGGVFMLGVHFLSKKIPEAEYGTVAKLIAATIIIPTIPLQMVFAREAAAALATDHMRAFVGMVRKTLAGLVVLWAVFTIGLLLVQGSILELWKISDPMTLWLFLVVMLGSLVMPVFMGTLQGQQNFLWLGFVMILNAALRLAVGGLLVFLVTPTASGVMAGLVGAAVICTAIAMWQTRALWTGPSDPFPVVPFLKQIIPLMIGFGTCQFLFSADTIFVGRFFSAEQTGYYGAAGTLSRALMWLVLPLAAVMFPKLVHSAAKAQKTNLLTVTLVSTGALCLVGAIGLTIVGPLAVKIVYTQNYVGPATAIIPWYAGAMIPLSVANVLVNSLLARKDFRVVPWMAIIAVAYGVTLALLGPQAGASGVTGLGMILKTMAGFTTLLFLICSYYTWRPPAQPKPVETSVIASA